MVWAALNLEDVTYTVCRAVQPRHGPSDDTPIGTRIDEALTDLKVRPDDGTRAEANAWLEEAKGALEDRNSVVQSTPITPFIEDEDGSIREFESALMHIPALRAQKKGRTITSRAISVEALREVRVRLVSAREGWSGLASRLWSERLRGREDPAN